MTTKLTSALEPYFSNPKRRDFVRRILFSNMNEHKKIIMETVDHSFGSVLDFGCGTGEFSEIFPSESYHGVDIDSKGVYYAKKSHPKYSFTAISDITDVKESYDLVVLIDTLHHLSPEILKRTLSELQNRVLKTNGKLMVVDDMHPEEQRMMLGKWIFKNDRGGFPRTKEQAVSTISGSFEVVSYKVFQENFVTFYALLATPIRNKA